MLELRGCVFCAEQGKRMNKSEGVPQNRLPLHTWRGSGEGDGNGCDTHRRNEGG